MTSEAGAAKPPRALRADAQRNYDSLLRAAVQELEELTAPGGQMALEAVARRAGVSIATLYRHFPTREALFLAVYRREMQEFGQWADQLLTQLPPEQALARWLRKIGRYGGTRPGMADAFRAAAAAGEEQMHDAYGETIGGLKRLLRHGVATAAIRGDIHADDVMLALCGVWELPDTPDAHRQSDRVVNLILDGLRQPSRDSEPHPT
ncbi:TetR/AcrR family transcriptional regulator [Nocardia pseudovaccinii]|uniref:TetR/AcrR family transcriptional regulator n=1 Tax=Nocardia pseudovaccinii TaxID=189540 RepID=UPI003D9289A7